MSFLTRTRLAFALYLTLNLCLLGPLHLLHLDGDIQSLDRFGQTGGDGSLRTPHDSGSCPTCQLANGQIDLPSQADLSFALVTVSILSEDEVPSISVWESTRPTPRAPPNRG